MRLTFYSMRLHALLCPISSGRKCECTVAVLLRPLPGSESTSYWMSVWELSMAANVWHGDGEAVASRHRVLRGGGEAVASHPRVLCGG